jgi:hypothetical protein
MRAYTAIDIQVIGLIGNVCQHVYMDILHFPFKAILLYSGIHFIEKQFAALAAKATSTTRKAPEAIVGSKRSNNHDDK